MKKRIYQNFLLSLSLVAFVVLSCDKRSEEEKWQAEIRYFISLQADDFSSYQSIDFQKIDLDFFASNKEIQRSLITLQDTTRTKLKYYATLAVQSELLVDELTKKLGNFPVDQVDEFLMENIRLDKALNTHFGALPTELLAAKAKEEEALSILNSQLSAFNLSIYNINLTNGNSVFYYHKFGLKNGEHSGIFELDKESLEVLSFKEI